MIRVILSGATGKVGRALLPVLERDPRIELVAAAAPSLELTLADALATRPADVVVDFSVPGFAAEACELCLAARLPLVLGTSGLAGEELEAHGQRAGEAGLPIFHAPNFAIGAVLMMRFAEAAAPRMDACEIVELHADTKKDAPSGTARATAQRIGGDVPIHSVRLPGLVAHQEVIFGAVGQTLTIRHDTTSRDAFAPGVLLAIDRIRDLPAGLTSGWTRCSGSAGRDLGDLVAERDRAALEHVRHDPAAVHERLDHAGGRHLLQVRARLAQLDGAAADRPHAELATHQVVEPDAAGHHLPAGAAVGQVDAVLVAHRLKRLGLDQRQRELARLVGPPSGGVWRSPSKPRPACTRTASRRSTGMSMPRMMWIDSTLPVIDSTIGGAGVGGREG